MKMKNYIYYFLLCALVLGLGCSKKIAKRPDVLPTTAEASAEKSEPSIRYDDWQSNPELKTVYFEYDSSELLESARQILKKNSEFLKQNQDLNVLIEGHCDERGTLEYNLALGQRRASVVRDYYGKLGISVGRIGTISYGEEKPFNKKHNEEAWSKNRRAETKIRTVQNAKNHVDDEQE